MEKYIEDFIQIIVPYLKMILNGLITSLAPIVAAMGIVINNRKAYKRDMQNREKNLKINILEKMYEMLNEYIHWDINFWINIPSYQRQIVDELIESGTSTYIQNVKEQMTNGLQKLIDLEMYKQELRNVLQLSIHFEKLIDMQKKNYHSVESETEVLDMIVRLMVRKYAEGKDMNTNLIETINELKKIRDEKNNSNIIYKVDIYSVLKDMNGTEKKQLKEIVYAVIDEFNLAKDYTNTSDEIQKIEETIAKYIHDIIY